MQKKKRRNKTKRIWMGILLCLGLYVGVTFYQQQQEMKQLRQQEARYLQELEKIQQDIDNLKQQVEISNHDEYIETIARQQLKMIGSNEMIIIDIGQQ
ncbi:FtsB family cell division protein [Natronincola ferrireducens]|uniref:Cell division protein DivIC n=1 Tax=Natronincola ferrireducens TaxID=393762 RepID=A0A1G8X240_9FIRM|nr:septum formation initiator family protein [Natronincola ferrireducens]SDJ83810.1 cell division protein DivIC [Natronincola ferrireducens]